VAPITYDPAIGPLRLGFEADLGLIDHLQTSIINYSLILDAISSIPMVGKLHPLNLQYILIQDSFYRYVMVVPLGGKLYPLD
jgi:hypothetical protein